VSAISLPNGGFRLACNRDELLTRPTARPPVCQPIAHRNVVFPIDPQSGGTWVAVNGAGVAMALLNLNPPRRLTDATQTRQSRGLIIPSLLHYDDAIKTANAARNIHPLRYPPFLLVIIDSEYVAQIRSDGGSLSVAIHPFDDQPLMFTSSGLGDHLVEQPRRELFDRIVRSGPSVARQDAFHTHHWPDRPHLSVLMTRADARTVSRTTIDVRPGVARMTYLPIPIEQLQPS